MTLHDYELKALRRYYHRESFAIAVVTFAVTVLLFFALHAWLNF